MEKSIVISWLFLFFGVLIFAASIFNWDYFFKQRKAKMLVKAIGINGARIIYALLGLFFSLVGANQIFNWGILPF